MSAQLEMDFRPQLPFDKAQNAPRFNGSDYEPAKDHARLWGQVLRIFEAMRDGIWRTLPEIRALTGDPEASISAQLRHLRKDRFGAHTVDKRRRGDESAGLWEYQLIPNTSPPAPGLPFG